MSTVNSYNPRFMQYLLTLFTALAISMALIPIALRFAPALGMVDKPNARKVHTEAIARVGGIGIVIGTLVPVLLWLPQSPEVVTWAIGGVILLIFGMWDDARDIGPGIKFIGQFMAAGLLVYGGDVYVHALPLMESATLSEPAGKLFTLFAIVGMVNATNHSDGLDGLASGLSMLSLLPILVIVLSQPEADATTLAISLALLGGIFGFLRYNTHPARVFMGDTGSQFLGFTLGFLAVYLTQQVNTALSPALPALILGLPIMDTLVVTAQRLRFRMSLFTATRNHLHHRMIDLGLHHYEAVVVIYSVQFLFVLLAIKLPYGNDALILGIYLGVCATLFGVLFRAKRIGWQHPARENSPLARWVESVQRSPLVTTFPQRYMGMAIPALFLFVALIIDEVPSDIAMAAGVLLTVTLTTLLLRRTAGVLAARAACYITAAFVIYLEANYRTEGPDLLEQAYYGILVAFLLLSLKFSQRDRFQTSPTDVLILFLVIALALIAGGEIQSTGLSAIVAKTIAVFYCCELYYNLNPRPWNMLNAGMMVTLAILAVRGILS